MKYFGTDGVRAVAGQYPLVQDFVESLGFAAVKEIERTLAPGVRKTVLIGQDGRESGPRLMQYLANGIKAAGFEVISLGIVPTPAVSYLVQRENCAFGAVISASHNPAEFNGIKFFCAEGKKLPESMEEKVENTLLSLPKQVYASAQITENPAYKEDYISFLVYSVKTKFTGKKIVLDCAHGATYLVAGEVFKRLGADVILTGNTPNGKNINEGCGALFTSSMQELVKKENAFAGFSFDGDGDRLIASDSKGRQLDGDYIISACALMLKERGLLKKDSVVLTIMANLAVINFLKERGLNVPLTGVGDKYVSEEMEKNDYVLGGETSGHIIFRNFSPTGDGILAAVQFLAMAIEDGKDFVFFKDMWHSYPSKLTAVKVDKKIPLDDMPAYKQVIADIEKDFGGKGRVVVRYSGTEPKFRILVEGEDSYKVDFASKKLEEEFKKEISKHS